MSDQPDQFSAYRVDAKSVYGVSKHSSGGSNLRAVVDGVEYKWGGGFGAVISSSERGVKAGEMRMILGVPMHAYVVQKAELFWQKPEVWWTIPSDHNSAEWVREFKGVLFGV